MAPPTIPLKCIVCPKLPSFSDVSHLLTHVASKGHLSCLFRLQVKAAKNEEAAATLAEYLGWYKQWGIEELMSERLNLKDKKRPRAKSTGKL